MESNLSRRLFKIQSVNVFVAPLSVGLFALVAADFSEAHDFFKGGGASFDVLPTALLQRAHALLDCSLADRAR